MPSLDLRALRVGRPHDRIECVTNSGPAAQNQIRVRSIANRYGRGPVEKNLINDRLEIANPQGQIIGTCTFADSIQELGDAMLRAQVDGGLVFVETVKELIAFDMYRTEDNNMDPRFVAALVVACTNGPSQTAFTTPAG